MNMHIRFHDRHDAGLQLAHLVAKDYEERKGAVVLALPRGGVPVAFEIARTLHMPLDLMLVRKLGVPGNEELAMGAVAMNDVCVFNHDVIGSCNVTQDDLDHAILTERQELERRNRLYRAGRLPLDLTGRAVLLVDDGVATGANMYAALNAVAQQHPAYVAVATPVAAHDACAKLKTMADQVFCLHMPETFFGVGNFYDDFRQVNDQEVVALMQESHRWEKSPMPEPAKARRRDHIRA